VRGVRWGNVDTRDIPADNRRRRVPNRGDEERGGEGSDRGRERGNEWGGERSDRGSERGDEREVRGDERGRWRDDGGSEEGDERGGRGERRGDRGGGGGGAGDRGDGGGSGGGEGNGGDGDRGRGDGGRRTGSDGQSHDANEIMNNRDFGSFTFRRNSAADRCQDDVDPLGVSSMTVSTGQAGGDNSRVGTTTSQGVDDVINDDLVRKTRRQFKQDWFHERQQPYEHLEAERLAHLNLATYYSSANQKTRVQIIIAMCSNKLMLLSQKIVEAHGSFVEDFLTSARNAKFCIRIAFKNCLSRRGKCVSIQGCLHGKLQEPGQVCR
jgi:hypothetical protein